MLNASVSAVQISSISSRSGWGVEIAKAASIGGICYSVLGISLEKAFVLGAAAVVGYRYVVQNEQMCKLLQVTTAQIQRMIRSVVPLAPSVVPLAPSVENVVRLEVPSDSLGKMDVDPRKILETFQETIHENLCRKNGSLEQVAAARDAAIEVLTSFKDATLDRDTQAEDCIQAIDLIYGQLQEGSTEDLQSFLSANCPCCLSARSSQVDSISSSNRPSLEILSEPCVDLSGQLPHPAAYKSSEPISRSSLSKSTARLFFSTRELFSSKKKEASVEKTAYASHGFTQRFQINGDGNCYYRAVMFASLKHAIEKDRSLLPKMKNAFAAIKHTLPEENQEKHKNLLIYLEKIIQDQSFTVDQLIQDLNAYPSLDRTMVRAARYLLAYELSDGRIEAVIDEVNNTHPQKGDSILTTTIQQFRGALLEYRPQVPKDAVWADGEYTSLHILPKALGMDVGIGIMQSDGNVVAACSDEGVACSRLLFSGTHYDVVCK